MKVLFLDHDGVICLSAQWGGRYKKKGYDNNPDTPLDIRMDSFDKKAVDVLNHIVDVTGCEIVVSSDWKRWGTIEQMRDMYITRGIKPPIDLTPDLKDFDSEANHFLKTSNDYEGIRVLEINKYLSDHPEITHWVAVDDMDLGEKIGPISGNSNGGLKNFVITKKPYNEGIKQSGIKEKIIKFLND
jgi:hypothetical protein